MDTKQLTTQISTFGCKVNTYDTGLLQQRLKRSGHFAGGDLRGVHILNSCAVTKEATQEALRQARKIKRLDPAKKVVLTGCAAQVDGELLDQEEAFDLIIGNSHKAEVPDLIKRMLEGKTSQKVYRANIFRQDDLGVGGGQEENHTRSYLKIQDGCNSFCSFCVIPYARGTSRSLSINHLIERVHELQKQGYQEVVLTGVHIGDYQDIEGGRAKGLDDLVENLLNFTTIPRLRLSSLEPIEISDRLLDLFSNERLCPHFHISLQSAHTGILKRMKRKYSSENIMECFNKIHQKIKTPLFIGMDVIVGFPGESELDFRETYDRLDSLAWNHIHVFPYSERSGTKATFLENSIPWSDRKDRAKSLRALSEDRYKRTALDQVGRLKKVLLTGKKEDHLGHGIARDFWKVELPLEMASQRSEGAEQTVKVRGFDLSRSGMAPLLADWVSG